MGQNVLDVTRPIYVFVYPGVREIGRGSGLAAREKFRLSFEGGDTFVKAGVGVRQQPPAEPVA